MSDECGRLIRLSSISVVVERLQITAMENEITGDSKSTLRGQTTALTCSLICASFGALVLHWAWASPDGPNNSAEPIIQHIIAIVLTAVGSLALLLGVFNSIFYAVKLVYLLVQRSRSGDVQ